MQTRRSRDPSTILSLIPMAISLQVPFTQRTFRTATARQLRWPPSVVSTRGYAMLFGDGGYAGNKLDRALACMGERTIEIIKRSAIAEGFQVLPRRWVARTPVGLAVSLPKAWHKDFEATIACAVAWVLIAQIHILTRA